MFALAAHYSVLARDTGERKPHDISSGLALLKDSGESVRQIIVPVSVENGLVVVNVLINGQGPFPMIFDTGSTELISSEAAIALGLVVGDSGTVIGSGEKTFAVSVTQLKDLRVGEALLANVVVPVVPFPRFFTDRGADRRSPVPSATSFLSDLRSASPMRMRL